jgi:hypothetical protein
MERQTLPRLGDALTFSHVSLGLHVYPSMGRELALHARGSRRERRRALTLAKLDVI